MFEPGHDELIETLRERDLAEARRAVEVASFEASQQWALVGSVNVTQWLTHHGRLSRDDATRLLTLGRTLASFPATGTACLAGDLSTAQVRVIARNVTPGTEEFFERDEPWLVPKLIPLSNHDTYAVMRYWRVRAEAERDADKPPAEPDASEIRHSRVGDRWKLDGDLDAKDGELVDIALTDALTDDVDGETPRTYAQRRADAFTDICRYYLDHRHSQKTSKRRRPHVTVEMTLDELEQRSGARLPDGTPIDPATVQQLLCDCSVSRLLRAGSTILDYGRSTRTVPYNLRKVVTIRDRHCRFSSCDRPPQWCEVHHHIPWDPDGPTDLDNLVLLCNRHHHLLHQPDWHSTLERDGTLTITTPQGRTLQTHPPP